MTRFARAKGSKSSNARVAQEATNWKEFHGQKNQLKPDPTRVDEVRNVAKKFKQESQSQSGSDWADFGVTKSHSDQPNVSKKRNAMTSDETIHGAKKQKLNNGQKSNPSPAEEPASNKPGKGKKKKKALKKFQDASQPKDTQKLSKPTSDGNPKFKRRKPFVEFTTLRLNGMSIDISKFDGFDVKHEDAVRLKEIRSKMLSEGIPEAEVDVAIKRERRNAEKQLSREKKKVCFNCRCSGHVLSDCPELSQTSESIAVNICYKCGSTEHTHFQCQVKKTKTYSFATCFICKEQGHISSQCPDNPKGLYPQGGSCKVCGEVTHLKKDCPQLSKERSENAVTLETMTSNSNLESLGEEMEPSKTVIKPSVKKQKIVKF